MAIHRLDLLGLTFFWLPVSATFFSCFALRIFHLFILGIQEVEVEIRITSKDCPFGRLN